MLKNVNSIDKPVDFKGRNLSFYNLMIMMIIEELNAYVAEKSETLN